MTTPDANGRRDHERLLDALFIDQPTPEVVRQVDELLQTDEDFRRTYLETLSLRAELEWSAVSPPQPMGDTSGPAPKPKSRVHSFLARPTILSLTVAALAIGLLVTAMAFMAAPFYQRIVNRPDENPQDHPARVVAPLTGLHEPTWADDKGGPDLGAFLQAGRRMKLREGLAEIRFDDGALVTLEGPANWTVVDEETLRLDVGQMVARVPQKAIGFVVETAAARITDLGTEFGARAQPDGTTDAHVFEGHVSVAGVDDSSGDPRILTAGQSIRITRDDGVSPLREEITFVHSIRLPNLRGKTEAFASYEYVDGNSDPRAAINTAANGEGYPDDQRRKLIDGRIGTRYHNDGRWVGWFDSRSGDNEEPQPGVVLDVGKAVSFDQLQVAYLVQPTSGIHAPDRVLVSVSGDGIAFEQIHEFHSFEHQWENTGAAALGSGTPRIAQIALPEVEARYVRLEFYNTNQWTFLSEVRFTSSSAATNE